MIRRIWATTTAAIRRYFLAGLLAFAPIGITVWAIAWIIGRLDNLLLPRLLELLFPGVEAAPSIPPLVGALFTFLVILLAGVIARHLFGGELIRIWERLLSRVPVARSIYGGIKQLFEAILGSSSTSERFQRVVLVEYPRKHLYALAFATGETQAALQRVLPHERLVNCFIPTTPNPTSGFYLIIPEEEIYDVDLSVEQAFKMIMSAGLVAPDQAGGDGAIPPPPDLLPPEARR
ncbi:MAG: DUF502 domain-containing protein [Myxococcota bacterium]